MLLSRVADQHVKVSITAILNTISAYWHMAGVAFIVLVLIVVPDNHQSVGLRLHGDDQQLRLLRARTSGSIIFLYVFGLGLLMAQYTITGFDASAHMAEETHQASRMAAVGMYMSVVVSVVFGFILLVAVTFAIPSTQGVLESGRRRRDLHLDDVDGPDTGRRYCSSSACVAQIFCLTASVTSASRMMFAFSRDGAVPGHRLWRKVGAQPRAASPRSWAIGVLVWALMIPAYWNYRAATSSVRRSR